MDDIIREIRKAMETGELQAFYQPQYDAARKVVCSAEALVRWARNDGTIVPPIAFIPVAEQSDIILDIDWYMTEQVCQFLNELDSEGIRPYPISINFSRKHISEINYFERLRNIVQKYNVNPSLIEVEITESAMIDEPERILEWIKNIRREGFTVAIDDFGSGLSSLQFVKDMPADVLKIDKSMLNHNCEDEKERIVLESVFYFAHRLKMETVAEGVETNEQLEFLRTCDCQKIQGFIFAKPMPKAAFKKLCLESRTLNKDDIDILKIQSAAGSMNMLTDVIFRKYPIVIFANLTRNSYYMMNNNSHTFTGFPAAGVFQELIDDSAAVMHPDDEQSFRDTFSRDNLLAAHKEGRTEVKLITRQKGSDGVYRRIETMDYFVKSPSSEDVLVIALCDNIEY